MSFFERRWLAEMRVPEDSHGRVLWGLGERARERLESVAPRVWAAVLFDEALGAAQNFRACHAPVRSVCWDLY